VKQSMPGTAIQPAQKELGVPGLTERPAGQMCGALPFFHTNADAVIE
jgi:hypothetical protein